MDKNYAHNDTSETERYSATAQFVKLNIPDKLKAIRQEAFAKRIPIANDETLNFLITTVSALQPRRILELGTAVGVSGICMLNASPQSTLITVEKNDEFYRSACDNFKNFGLESRVKCICGDASDVIFDLDGQFNEQFNDGQFDFIFMDSAKVQYVKYLPRLKTLLRTGGVLLADDVLFMGYVTGEAEVPHKRHMLVQHIREYIDAVTADEQLQTSIINLGDGLALSVKK